MCDSIYTKLQKILANLQREEDQQMVGDSTEGGLDEKGHGKFGGGGVCGDGNVCKVMVLWVYVCQN